MHRTNLNQNLLSCTALGGGLLATVGSVIGISHTLAISTSTGVVIGPGPLIPIVEVMKWLVGLSCALKIAFTGIFFLGVGLAALGTIGIIQSLYE